MSSDILESHVKTKLKDSNDLILFQIPADVSFNTFILSAALNYTRIALLAGFE